MSRNKDIEVLHIISKEPYSVCRRKMKEAHWDLTRAIIGNNYFDKFGSIHKAIVEAFNNLSENLKETLNAVYESTTPIIKAVNESKRCSYCNAALSSSWFVLSNCPFCGEDFEKGGRR